MRRAIVTLLCGLVVACGTRSAPPATQPVTPPSAKPLTAVAGAIFAQTLQSAVSALNATGCLNTQARSREHAIYIAWSAGVTAGAVAVESATDCAYTGTWANLTTVNWVSASRQDVFRTTGSFGAIRTRISTAIVGGTVTTSIIAN